MIQFTTVENKILQKTTQVLLRYVNLITVHTKIYCLEVLVFLRFKEDVIMPRTQLQKEEAAEKEKKGEKLMPIVKVMPLPIY